MAKDYAEFFRALRAGGIRVEEGFGGGNVGEFRREVAGTVCVSARAEVPKILAEANRTGVPVYPFSRGANWGYGSKLPAENGGVLVDLSALDKIIGIDESQGLATIEPGVSQGRLSEELARRGSAYYLDVTGSGAGTSVIGNCLERGIAYGSLRVAQLAGLEVWLPGGGSFRTGFGEYPSPRLAGLYPYGLGPSLDGLFFQSNFGIVTEGIIQLARRPEGLCAISVAVADPKLGDFVDRAADLKRRGYLHGIPHLADRERTVSTIAPLLRDQEKISGEAARAITERVIDQPWMLTASVAGAGPILAEKMKVVRRELAPFGKIYAHDFAEAGWKKGLKAVLVNCFASAEQKMVIRAAAGLRGFHQGRASDDGIHFLKGPGERGVDEGAEGFLLCTPLAPLGGEGARIFRDLTREEAARFDTRVAMTLNLITDRVLEAVISLHFPRGDAAARDRAHACLARLDERFAAEGYYPYRVNIDQTKVPGRPPGLAAALASVKKALDPANILAPGRYL